MKKKISVSIILSLLLLIISVVLSGISLKTNKEDNKITVSKTQTNESVTLSTTEEMRGLWVSYLSLDMQSKEKDFNSFKNKFTDIIKEAKNIKCNTLIVQVRPFCDALYDSVYFPYSHILSGEQGVSPGYDALDYMCKAAHESGLEIHAWINPLRVKNNNSGFALADDNPYIKNNKIGFETESGIYLNPADNDARQLIIDGVKEIVEKYDVDGIQFDDYFYPDDISDEDSYCYKKYKESINQSNTPLSLQEWRENNINLLISETYIAIKSAKKEVVFGISPQGNIDNNKNIYADVLRWCETFGYVDYICPQLYYSPTSKQLSFEDALKDWQNLNYHSHIKVYIGLAAYKAGSDEDGGTWLESDDILVKELILLRNNGYDGYIIYEYKSLKNPDTKEEIENLINVI